MLCAFITKPTLVPIILLFPWLLCAHYCTVDTHANLLSVLWGLFELCVYTNTVHWPRCTVLYSCTEFPLWPIRASHPSNQWHHRKCVTDRQTNRQTDKQTDRQTNRHIHAGVYRVAPQLKTQNMLKERSLTHWCNKLWQNLRGLEYHTCFKNDFSEILPHYVSPGYLYKTHP